jgi:hypothetical protein
MTQNMLGEAERFWDQDAREFVSGHIVVRVSFAMDLSRQCAARGVMLTDDGTVYTWTIRRPGHEDMNGCRRIATRVRGTLRDNAFGLLEFERKYVEPGLYVRYGAAIRAL